MEMNAFDDAIRLQDKQVLSFGIKFHHGAIIAGTGNDGAIERKMGQEFAQQFFFAERAQIHCGKISGKASAIRLKALKSECIVMETRMDPLHS